ncbi:MAG: pyruvate kinase [Firmicutes bacterium]|nr:pyruvate kinase [Bacillota bacterium]
MRRSKVVVTIGPASESEERLRQLVEAGMDVARFNLSHGGGEALRQRSERVRRAAEAAGRHVGLMFDTRGPEVRLGRFREGAAELVPGQSFLLVPEPVEGDRERASISYPGLGRDLEPGATLLLDDGNLVLRVRRVRSDGSIECEVVVGGRLLSGKKCLAPGTRLSLPPLLPEDEADLRLGLELEVDFVAASFVQTAEDVLAVRRFLEANAPAGARLPEIVTKVETRHAVDHFEEILEVSDGVMVARGDLGLEMATEEVPFAQKRIIALANRAGKPVITATQMLESMVVHASPTRAEAADVANAVLDGSDAVMLSAESATGAHPVEAVRMMARIAERADAELVARRRRESPSAFLPATVTEAISLASVTTATALEAAAIITPTQSGRTARVVAAQRPAAPVLAVTPEPATARRLSLVWGVEPLILPAQPSSDVMVERAVGAALEAGYIANGDLVVITAGFPVGVSGTTNTLKVHTVAVVVGRGQGIGHEAASGPACLAADATEAAARFRDGDVLVVPRVDGALAALAARAAALVVTEGGLSSPSAIVALNAGKPAIVGFQPGDGVEPLRPGETVTVDPVHGLLYRGRVHRI